MTIGGFVNIGIVFNEHYSLTETMGKMKDYIQKKGCRFLTIKYSKDIEGENWTEIEIKNNKLHDSFLNGYYISSELSGSIFDFKAERITLTIEKASNYHGFLFGINWDDIFPNENDESSIQATRQKIVNTLIEMYEAISYSYAFVGHEIEIEIDPEEFSSVIEFDHSYPVAIVSTKAGLNIYYGSIGIDGFSKEVPRKEIISI